MACGPRVGRVYLNNIKVGNTNKIHQVSEPSQGQIAGEVQIFPLKTTPLMIYLLCQPVSPGGGQKMQFFRFNSLELMVFSMETGL